MCKAIQNLLILVLVISYSPFAISAESSNDSDSVTIVGGAAYIIKTSELAITDTTFNPEYNSIDLSVVFVYKNFYSRVNFDQSISGDTIVDNSLDGNGEIENSIITFDREDAAITFGYSLFDNFAVFAGYKRGETSGFNGGQLRGFNQNMSGEPPDFLVSNTEFSILETGPFIVLSYTYFPEKTGSVNFSIAYANLDGDFHVTNAELDSAGDRFLTSQTVTGDNTGLSYSLSWTDVFSENLNYTIGLNAIRYTFETPIIPGEDNFSFDNNFTNFSIAFSKFF